jgi:cytosine/adenosine deaminase-related metal-dependent hydrolase
MAILLKNAMFVDFSTLEFVRTNIVVSEDNATPLTFIDELPEQSILSGYKEIIDCNNSIVTRSFVCGHHHAYSALALGMPAPTKNPENFLEILQYVWWKLDNCLDRETTEASALATAIACAKNGVTFVIDHHASPNHIENALDAIAAAFDKIGISHLLCYEISDRDGEERSIKGLEETERYLSKHQALVGLHASFTVSDETMHQAVKLAKKYKSGIHIHVAEDLYDQQHCYEKYGKRVVERLKDNAVLDFSKTILAHCIHINDKERELLKLSDTYIVQNMESNLNNKVGFFNSKGLNNNIMYGTDGMHSDMLRSSKATFYTGFGGEQSNYITIYERFRKVHKYLHLNGFEGDGENNLVVLDYNPPTDINQDNFLGHFIFGLESRHVKHVISSGKLIVKDRQLMLINEEDAIKQIRISAKKLWKKMALLK